MKLEKKQTLATLDQSCPGNGRLISGVVLTAHEVLGLVGKETEFLIARSVVDAFYNRGIVGSEIKRLNKYTNGDPKLAFDVLVNDEEYEKFKNSSV